MGKRQEQGGQDRDQGTPTPPALPWGRGTGKRSLMAAEHGDTGLQPRMRQDLPGRDRRGAASSDNSPTGPQPGRGKLRQDGRARALPALGSEERKLGCSQHGCSQHGPKGHTRPPRCRVGAGGSQPQLPALEGRGETRSCPASALPPMLPLSAGGEKSPRNYTWGKGGSQGPWGL